ncbi:MAG: membrane dipeptidase [Pseudomonadota bacterium]|nr:membrane dipeptidase [Pseudomonadota bacterium]
MIILRNVQLIEDSQALTSKRFRYTLEMLKVIKLLKFFAYFILFLSLAIIIFLDNPYKFTNSVVLKPPYEIDPVADEFHHSLFLADLHADTFTFVDTFMEAKDYGHIDYPRARAGGYNLLTMSIATKIPFGMVFRKPEGIDRFGNMIKVGAFSSLEPPLNWFSNYARGKWVIENTQRVVEKNPEQLLIIRFREDLQQLLNESAEGSDRIGLVLSVEGAHILEGNQERIEDLFTSGVRMLSLTHAFDNEYGGASEGIQKYGITTEGEILLERMNSLGMIIDIAHASPNLVNAILNKSTAPVVYSHGGIQGKCDIDRNLQDDVLEKIKANGGLIAIGFWGRVLCGDQVSDIVSSIRYIADRIGTENIALGSDFDGSVKTIFDASGLGLLTDGLLQSGFKKDEIKRIMGDNYARVLWQSLPIRNTQK